MGATQSKAECKGAVIVASQYQGKTVFASSTQRWTDIDNLLSGTNDDADVKVCQSLGNLLLTSNTNIEMYKPNVAVVCIPERQLCTQAPSSEVQKAVDEARALKQKATKEKVQVFTNFSEAQAYLENLLES